MLSIMRAKAQMIGFESKKNLLSCFLQRKEVGFQEGIIQQKNK